MYEHEDKSRERWCVVLTLTNSVEHRGPVTTAVPIPIGVLVMR